MSHLIKVYYCITLLIVTTTSFAFAEEEIKMGGTIKIGIDIGISGQFASYAEEAQNGINMAFDRANSRGVLIGDTLYTIEPLFVDNKGNQTQASKIALELALKDKVLALILPLSSNLAVQVANAVSACRIPAIAASSSSSQVTKGNPYAFRTVLSYADVAESLFKFSEKEWQAKSAAILYNNRDGYSTSSAHAVQEKFTKIYGENSIRIFKKFYPKGDDLNKQVSEIIKSDADFVYLPYYDTELLGIIQQFRAMGWTKPITAPDTLTDGFAEKCGETCKDTFFFGSFVCKGATDTMKNFVDLYKNIYKKNPTITAAASYDASNIIVQALTRLNSLSGNIVKDRANFRKAMATTRYEGATGKITYSNNSGEPLRCAMISTIDAGEQSKYSSFCPHLK